MVFYVVSRTYAENVSLLRFFSGVKSENIPPSQIIPCRVDCGRPRIYPGVDPEL